MQNYSCHRKRLFELIIFVTSIGSLVKGSCRQSRLRDSFALLNVWSGIFPLIKSIGSSTSFHRKRSPSLKREAMLVSTFIKSEPEQASQFPTTSFQNFCSLTTLRSSTYPHNFLGLLIEIFSTAFSATRLHMRLLPL